MNALLQDGDGLPAAPGPGPAATVLRVSELSVRFKTRSGDVHALEHVSLDARRGEILGIVGESGSGKSVLSLALMGLLDHAAHIDAGEASFVDPSGQHYPLLPERRGPRAPLAMIFQSPRTALNPIRRVGDQLIDVLRRHDPGPDLRGRARALLAQVKITDPERRLSAFPFELSGGMCQRVMIALALASKPTLLIADEPTTGLDVTTQAATMELLRELSRTRQMSTLLITHDLNLAAEYCDRLCVMHAGHTVECGPTEALLTRPRHPYTARLIAATPGHGSALEDLQPIPGQLPDLRALPLPPCRFSARCERRKPECGEPPGLRLSPVADSPEHAVACRSPLA